MSSVQLARWVQERHGQTVPDDYKWNQRNFVSMDAETERWAAWLSELTGVGGLDRLSLAPWRQLLGVPGLVPKSDRWCPCCLAEDRTSGHDPYLRLSWDISPVTACLAHKINLTQQCPHCRRSNVRNRASLVVPGYCTACGGFLGVAQSVPATPESLWVARQIGFMLASPPLPIERDALTDLMREVVSRMAGGNVARFSKRLDLSKSGVWHWVNKGGLPTIRAWLGISLHGGIALEKLMRGDLDGWEPPLEPPQLVLDLPPAGRKGIPSRVLDWAEITAQLHSILREEVPIPLAEASERTGVEAKLLYLRTNREARAIATRYRDFRVNVKRIQAAAMTSRLELILAERLAGGYEGMSARDIRDRLAGTDLANMRNTFALIKGVREGSS
jgi:hypothetical protein